MTTPTGQISALDINTELGKPTIAQMSLNDSDVRTLAGIPSGQISFDNLRGKSSVVITLNEETYAAYSTYKVCTSSVRISSTGYVQQGFDGSYGDDYLWCNPASAVDNYEIYATTADAVSGTLDAWVNCNTSPTWVVVSPGGLNIGTVNLQIRRIGTTTVLDSANITLEAEVLF